MRWFTVPATLGLAITAFAQSGEDRAPAGGQANGNASTPVSMPNGQRALGSVLQGPIDVTTTVTASPAPGASWIRELGCAAGWGYYWVSGGAGTTGAFAIHQYDAATGAYIGSTTQVGVGTSIWGMRDLAVDEAGFKLWGGQENRVFKEYTFTPPPGGGPNGTLTYTTSYTIPTGGTFTSTQTIRALARNPATGNFFTKNFNTALWEFSIAGGVPTYVGEVSGTGTPTYGLAWDTLNTTMWQFDQVPATTDGVSFMEIDTFGVPTARTFTGVTYGVANTNIAGGCDFFDDGSGTTKMLALHQNTVDELYVYEIDSAPVCATVDTCDPTLPDATDGCTPDVSWAGTPDVTQCNTAGPSDFVVTFGAMSENKNCNVVVGKGAPAPLAWSAESTRCFPATFARTGQQDTGDVNGATACGGEVSLDVEAFLQTGFFTAAVAGEDYVVQTWYRDPASTKTTQMTDACHFTVCP